MNETTVHLTDFTAAADIETFAAAMSYCREHPGTTLIVPPGTYHITSDLAKRAMNSVMTGEWGRNPQRIMFNPKYEYTRGISFDGQRGTRVIANGAVLMIEGFMEPVSVINCSDIELCGLTIDHLRKPYSRGTILDLQPADAEGNRECVIEFDEECPICEHSPLTLRYIFYDPETEHNIYTGLHGYTFVDEYHLRAKIGDHPALHDGMLFYTVHSFHSRPGILIENAKNIRLTDVTIHSQPGMGIVGNRSEDVIITGLKVVPSEGHHMSTDTDATHFTSMKGLLRFENCVFDGQGDDFTNVHSYYQAIIAREDANTCIMQEKTPDGTHAQTLDYPDIGDTLELTNRKTLRTVGHYTVVDCVPMHDDWMCRVTLDKPLPEDTEDLVLSDITRLPRVELVNCTATRHFARSILLKNRDALIENCTFRDVMGPAIVAAAEAWWYEGVCPANITIRGNKIYNCAETWGEAAGIVVKADSDQAEGCSIFNITIEDNYIECPNGKTGIFVRNTDGVTIRNNTIVTNVGYGIHVEGCDNVEIQTVDRMPVRIPACKKVILNEVDLS
ncbi:MAG: right-handed parallel beta-helix repeat-containing protein [Clostridia bacterium]|nr:right-handed parallel beta-helix repeat-containing protein [Clostridia bacterium]